MRIVCSEHGATLTPDVMRASAGQGKSMPVWRCKECTEIFYSDIVSRAICVTTVDDIYNLPNIWEEAVREDREG